MKSVSLLKKLGFVYLTFLHVLIAVLIFKTNFLVLVGKTLGVLPAEEFHDQLYQDMFAKVEAFQQSTSPKMILFGDSLSTKIPERSLPKGIVNLAVGGLTTAGAGRLLHAVSPEKDLSVIIELGVNDLKYRSPRNVARDIKAFVGQFSAAEKIVLVGLLPVDMANSTVLTRPYLDNEVFSRINADLMMFCEKLTQCSFLSTGFLAGADGNLRREYSVSDGWHLSLLGAETLGEHITKAYLGAL